MGGVYFPIDDSKESRVLSVCVLDPDQTTQIINHELIHICAHNHKHYFETREERAQHLVKDKYTEEEFAALIGPCLTANQDKLFDAFEAHNVHVSRSVQSDRPRTLSRTNKCKDSEKTVSCKR